jgi:hypothetical protein
VQIYSKCIYWALSDMPDSSFGKPVTPKVTEHKDKKGAMKPKC